MIQIKFDLLRTKLEQFDFKSLFVDALTWRAALERPIIEDTYRAEIVAQMAKGTVKVWEVYCAADIPAADERERIHKELPSGEHLTIFTNHQRSQSLWFWLKRETTTKPDGKAGPTRLLPRYQWYFRGQAPDLIISRLSPLFFDLSQFTTEPELVEVAERLAQAFDVQPVIKRFYEEFYQKRLDFVGRIEGIDNEQRRRWYASVILNRIMFVCFLQKKRFINKVAGDPGSNGPDLDYLSHRLAAFGGRTGYDYYDTFLKTLFFEGFAKQSADRAPGAEAMIGDIVYLNGGLFLKHQIELDYPNIRISNEAFGNILKLLGSYTWNLNDTLGGAANEINPDVLGYIFEKYINQHETGADYSQKESGAYYTRPEITDYLARETIGKLVMERVQERLPNRRFGASDTLNDLIANLDLELCRVLLDELPRITILDPACGSGAFLVAAMKVLMRVYTPVTGFIEHNQGDHKLNTWLAEGQRRPDGGKRSINYYVKKSIITNNLFGVDIMAEATEIARLRLFLNLVASANSVDELEPLPNIDFNIMPGNSLIGLLKVEEYDDMVLSGSSFTTTKNEFQQILAQREALLARYRNSDASKQDLQELRADISALHDKVQPNLNNLLLHEFDKKLHIRYEQVALTGKPKSLPPTLEHIVDLDPFHWGYEFSRVVGRGGFDIILTNPPWEIFKPQAKEFFAQHSVLISKKKMDIKAFEQQQARLLQDPEVGAAWVAYLSHFPFASAYFRASEQYANQSTVIEGKTTGSDVNLYKLFIEQCYNLLRVGGDCGIVVPSGIYTDQGAAGLRKLLFKRTQLTGLFGFENRRNIFDGVDSRFKFVVLTFRKYGPPADAEPAATATEPDNTISFPAAFMRHEVSELDRFPREGGIRLPVALIRSLSPSTESIMEVKGETDVQIARKLLEHPLLGDTKSDKVKGKWQLKLTREFDMTNDSYLFQTKPEAGRLPLYEGKMMWHFTHQLAEPRYWVDEKAARKAILGRVKDEGQPLDYQSYRIGVRAVASSTNERSLISSVVPSNVFCGNSLLTSVGSREKGLSGAVTLFADAVMSSFVLDWLIRMKVTTNINMFYIYQLPVPRYSTGGPYFAAVVQRAARLICTTPQYDALAAEVGLGNHSAGISDAGERDQESPQYGISDAGERAQVRAELDALVAHVYGLTADEYAHILSTFKLTEAERTRLLAEYERWAGDAGLAALVAGGEAADGSVEFKVGVRLNPRTNQPDNSMVDNVVRAVACYLNSKTGGTILLGVNNKGQLVGIEREYATVNPQKVDQDGYTLYLNDKINGLAGLNDPAVFSLGLVRISYGTVGGKTLCRIDVQPGPHPYYVGGEFYARTAGSCVRFNTQQADQYKADRWGQGS